MRSPAWFSAVGFAVLALASCGDSSVAKDATKDAGSSGPVVDAAGADASLADAASTEGQRLGLNDVSVLLPLAAAQLWPAERPGKTLIPRVLIDRLARTPGTSSVLLESGYELLRVVAVRFDLCERTAPGACAKDADGRFRLVLQPVDEKLQAFDVAFHAFYTIPSNKLGEVVKALRTMHSPAVGIETKLRVASAMDGTPENPSFMALKTLVETYASESTLQKLTFFSLESTAAQLQWFFHGVERKGAAFDDIAIPGISATTQHLFFKGGGGGRVGYEFLPVADSPAGTKLVLDDEAFVAAQRPAQEAAIDALQAAENPTMHTADTVQCATCHVSTHLVDYRSQTITYDATKGPSRFSAPSVDLSTSGGAILQSPVSFRAFGWLGQDPLISQRVVNESAFVLQEIEARFPVTAGR